MIDRMIEGACVCLRYPSSKTGEPTTRFGVVEQVKTDGVLMRLPNNGCLATGYFRYFKFAHMSDVRFIDEEMRTDV